MVCENTENFVNTEKFIISETKYGIFVIKRANERFVTKRPNVCFYYQETKMIFLLSRDQMSRFVTNRQILLSRDQISVFLLPRDQISFFVVKRPNMCVFIIKRPNECLFVIKRL